MLSKDPNRSFTRGDAVLVRGFSPRGRKNSLAAISKTIVIEAYPPRDWSASAGRAYLAGLAAEELEPCINGDVPGTGLFANQAEEDAFTGAVAAN